MSFAVRFTGLEPIERGLSRLGARGVDLREFLGGVGTVLETSTLERFEDEKAPNGQKWLPSFRARTTGGKTLTDTARLKQSIAAIVSPRQVEVGTNVIYARIHQEGGTVTAKGKSLAFTLPGLGLRLVRSAKIPRRPFLGLSRDDKEDIQDLFNSYFEDRATAG